MYRTYAVSSHYVYVRSLWDRTCENRELKQFACKSTCYPIAIHMYKSMRVFRCSICTPRIYSYSHFSRCIIIEISPFLTRISIFPEKDIRKVARFLRDIVFSWLLVTSLAQRVWINKIQVPIFEKSRPGDRPTYFLTNWGRIYSQNRGYLI